MKNVMKMLAVMAVVGLMSAPAFAADAAKDASKEAPKKVVHKHHHHKMHHKGHMMMNKGSSANMPAYNTGTGNMPSNSQ